MINLSPLLSFLRFRLIQSTKVSLLLISVFLFVNSLYASSCEDALTTQVISSGINKNYKSIIFERQQRQFLVSIAKLKPTNKSTVNPFIVQDIHDDGSIGEVRSYPINHNGLNYFVRDFEKFKTAKGEFILATVENYWLEDQPRYAIATFKLSNNGVIEHIDTESVDTLTTFANDKNATIGFGKYRFTGVATALKGGYKTPYVLHLKGKHYFMGVSAVRRQQGNKVNIEGVATFTEISATGNILSNHHYRDNDGAALMTRGITLEVAGFINTAKGSYLISTDSQKGLIHTRKIIVSQYGYPTIQPKMTLSGHARTVSVDLVDRSTLNDSLLIVGDRKGVSVYQFDASQPMLWQKINVIKHGNQLVTRTQHYAEVAASMLTSGQLLLAIQDITKATKDIKLHTLDLKANRVKQLNSGRIIVGKRQKVQHKPLHKIADLLIFKVTKHSKNSPYSRFAIAKINESCEYIPAFAILN